MKGSKNMQLETHLPALFLVCVHVRVKSFSSLKLCMLSGDENRLSYFLLKYSHNQTCKKKLRMGFFPSVNVFLNLISK